MAIPKKILPLIVLAQFCCTTLWFAGNAILPELVARFDLSENAMGNLTAAVQFGFILGTLAFAMLSIADRLSPSKVFFGSALAGAAFNLGMIWNGNHLESLLLFRLLTGFFMAGIYPVGMKIAADYFDKGLGRSLGFLVGALVLGTAFPHLVKNLTNDLPWMVVVLLTSALALSGGLIILLLVPDGPYRKASPKFQISAFFDVFRHSGFRAAAFGYFGHMWELYAFWAFVPLMLTTYQEYHDLPAFQVPLYAFAIIGIGSLACVSAGLLSQKYPTKSIAFTSLLLSGICCLLSPFFFIQSSTTLFLTFLFFWGVVVIADSPLFSTLVAQSAPVELKGTALTIVNCIGFAITIISIQTLSLFSRQWPSHNIYLILACGPVAGLYALSKGKTNPDYS